MLAWFQGAKYVDLIVGALLELRVLLEFLCLHHLYRHLLLRLYVYPLKHRRIHTTTDLALQVVVLDRFSHYSIIIKYA